MFRSWTASPCQCQASSDCNARMIVWRTLTQGYADALSTHKGKDFGGCLFLQPYHWLKGRSDATMPEWEAARQCLHDEDGTLGLYWVRAAPQPGFVSALATSLSGDVGVTSGLLPPLSKDDTPMTWVDSHITSTTFKPFKHRKFIERLEGTSTAVLPTLRIAHDVRVPLNGPCAVWEQAASHHSKGTHSVMLDLHCFHTTVVPLKKKVGAQHKR